MNIQDVAHISFSAYVISVFYILIYISKPIYSITNLALRLSIRTNEAETLKAEIGMLRGMLAESRQANKQLVKEVNILRTELEPFPADMRKECANRKIAEHFAEENIRFFIRGTN